MTTGWSTLSPDLQSWDEVADEADWSSLLIGNGASANVWEGFAYPNLYQTACDEDAVDDPLSEEDRGLFEVFGTVNFEEVLSALDTALVVAEVLGQERGVLHERAASVRAALIQAVKAMHVPWTQLPDNVLDTYNEVMRAYHSVYTTNYDLLVYWGLMRDRTGFRDYMWGPDNSFDRRSTDVPATCTRVLFLHGALHLLRRFDGTTWKRVADDANLLESFGEDADEGIEPLVITEGSAEDKLEAIHRSDYLAFGYEQFAADRAPLVIFGQGLSDQDAHLIRVVSTTPERRIAFGIRRTGTGAEIVKRKAGVVKALPDAKVLFFDARSHPLGDEALRVDPSDE